MEKAAILACESGSRAFSLSLFSRQILQWSRVQRTVWKRALFLKGEPRASGFIPETQEASGPLCVCVCVCVCVFGCGNG